jgi:flagellar protein FlaI
MNIILSIQRVHLVKSGEKRAYRRVMNVNEVVDYDNYNPVFKWSFAKDDHLPTFSKSAMLSAISERAGSSKKELVDEINRRKTVLQWMRQRNIRSYKDVAAVIAEYYARPQQIYDTVAAGEEVKVVAVSRNP